MQFSNNLNDGLVQTLDRLCSSTINTYPIKNKATDLNESLDWYFSLAFKFGLDWEIDDINNTLPPIDTQNLVSGTNRYKFSSFTEKIINLIHLECLDGSSNGLFLVPETFDTLGSYVGGSASGEIGGMNAQTFQQQYLNAPSGIPTHYIKYGDFVYLRPNPSYSMTSGLKAYFNRAANKFTFSSVTVDATTDTFTATSHGLAANDTVLFETDGTIPTGLTADQQYYVISSGLTANAFKVSITLGGSAVDITNAQTSSNHSFLKTSTSPGIVSTHHIKLCRKAAQVSANNFSNPDEKSKNNALVMQDEKEIQNFFANRSKEIKKRFTPAYQDNR